ncbi:hypothetical protein [uncultured Litoreibacter sp.]
MTVIIIVIIVGFIGYSIDMIMSGTKNKRVLWKGCS